MYETDYNIYKTMTLFNFFPKYKKFKYGLSSIQKENQSSNKNINIIGRRTTTKEFKPKLSDKNFFSSEKIRINNKNNYLTIQSSIKFYRTSTNFFRDKKNTHQINPYIFKDEDIDILNNEVEKKINVKNEFSIQKQQSNKNFFVDRLFSRYKNKTKNSTKEINITKTENAIKKNNYLVDENNVKICGIYKCKNKKNTKKSSIKFKTKENNNVKYYNNQLPLLNKVNNNSKKQITLKQVQNTAINSEKNSKKIFVFKNNVFVENNSNKENNNENDNENIFIPDNKKKNKKNKIYSSYNMQKQIKKYNKFNIICNSNNYIINDNINEQKIKKMKLTNSDFGNNNMILTNSNSKFKIFNKGNVNNFYNSQNNKQKAACSSYNLARKMNKNNDEKNMETKEKEKIKKQENSSKNDNIFTNFANINIFKSHRKRASVNGLHEVQYSLNAKKGFLKYENNLITNDNNLFVNTSKSNFRITSTMSNNNNNKLEKYNIGNMIGKGAYANVKLITNKITNEKFAMKIYEKIKLNDNLKKKCVYKEIEILKRINHKNIARLIEVIHTETQILIIQEFVKGISLRDYYNKEIRYQKGISEHKEQIFKKIFRQIFEAMNYLHCNHMAHRDIKLENILLTKEYEVKIIDFGFGMYNPDNKIQYFFCGTPNYIPPEIIDKKGYIGQKADLWSLGVLIYKVYCADFPFRGRNEKELYKAIKKTEYSIINYVPDNVKKIIKALIQYEPSKRPSCKEVLKSEWLRY